MIRTIVLIAVLLTAAMSFRADDKPQDVDWDKARQLHQREQKGDRLTPDEKAYLDHAKEVRRLTNQNRRPATGPALTPRDSTGLIPLMQMKPGDTYKGVGGGLYGGGGNTPPAELLHAAMDAAAKVQPLDTDGRPVAKGRVVLMSIGMSNTTQEFSYFKRFADADSSKSPKVTIVDAAQGGQDAARWDTTAAKSPWTIADERLRSAGVARRQVQVVWLKQAMITPQQLGEFPGHSDKLKQHIESIIRMAHERYPNLRLVYLSNRTYAGYATTPLNPEPYAYESAFAVRGVIEDQMKSELREPIVLWGPYLWTDGTRARSDDSLKWTHDDVGPDGTHPSQAGRRKIGELLLAFMKSDRTAKPWFCASGSTK